MQLMILIINKCIYLLYYNMIIIKNNFDYLYMNNNNNKKNKKVSKVSKVSKGKVGKGKVRL